MRTAIVGDIGGQIDVFHDVITSLGGDIRTGKFPDGLRVIQVGDIIRFNPHPDLDSLACAELAEKLIQANNGNYIQLLGNHETPLLGGALDPHWATTDLPECRAIVKSWWNDAKASIGAVLTAPGEKDILITHAGLTRGYMEHLGVSTAKEAVSLMNGFVGEVNLGGIERPGWLVTGSHNQAADTFWALCGIELNGSWWGDEGSGFNQIHGHACLYEWDGGEFWPDVSPEIRRNTLVNMADRFTITQHPNGDWFRSVDWVLKNERKRQKWPVLILPGFDVYLGE